MRRLVHRLLAATLGLLLAACGGDEAADTTQPDRDPDSTEVVELSVTPACVEATERFRVVADGLEPGAEYRLLIEPRPDPLEAGASVEADEEGVAELPGSIPEAVDVTGEFTWRLLPPDSEEVLATATFEIADPCAPVEEGSWHELPAAPIANRLNHSATWGDGLVMIWGGQDQERRRLADDGAAWDPGTGEWREIPAAPIEARWSHDAVWTGDELLVWGGSEGPDHLADCHTDGARYDPVEDTWAPVAPAPGPQRCAAVVAWTGDELLVFGGHRGGGPPGPDSRHGDGVAYDPDRDEWRRIPEAPIAPRAAAVGGWVDGELIVYGGHTHAPDGQGFEYLADGAAYDPDRDEWRVIASSPVPAVNGQEGVVVDGRLVVFGGQDPEIGADEASTAVAAYDATEDAWTRLSDLPIERPFWDGVSVDGVIYAIGSRTGPTAGGDEAPASPSFLAYVVGGDRWLERPDPPGGGRSNHAVAWTGAELIVWGGQSDGGDAAPVGLRWQPPG